MVAIFECALLLFFKNISFWSICFVSNINDGFEAPAYFLLFFDLILHTCFTNLNIYAAKQPLGLFHIIHEIICFYGALTHETYPRLPLVLLVFE